MPKLHEVIGGTKTKIYCQGTICQRSIPFMACHIGSDKVVNQAKPLKFSDKSCFYTNLKQMFNIWPPTLIHSQQ